MIKNTCFFKCLVVRGSPVGAGDDCFVMPNLIRHLTLKFVFHIAYNLAVEEVDDALGTSGVLL